jgi:hypothetical protein
MVTVARPNPAAHDGSVSPEALVDADEVADGSATDGLAAGAAPDPAVVTAVSELAPASPGADAPVAPDPAAGTVAAATVPAVDPIADDVEADGPSDPQAPRPSAARTARSAATDGEVRGRRVTTPCDSRRHGVGWVRGAGRADADQADAAPYSPSASATSSARWYVSAAAGKRPVRTSAAYCATAVVASAFSAA